MPCDSVPNFVRLNGDTWVAGVDGCRGGWLVAARNRATGEQRVAIMERIKPFLDGIAPRIESTVIDMPLGLPDAGPRACEAMARRRLEARRSSVFSAPRRPMLDCATYAEANAIGRNQTPSAGLSIQAWNIVPKIRELDAAVSPDQQSRIVEGHPELAFTRIAGGRPCSAPKRTATGAAERQRLLMQSGIDVDALVRRLRADGHRASAFAPDDVVDACVLTLTAEARLDGTAWRLSDDARDARGLVMEIWG